MLICGLKKHCGCLWERGRLARGNHDAAENAAIIYTFMGCSKLAQVDVRKWLNFKSILTIRGLLMAYVSSASVRLRSIRTLTLHSS
ncbi:MAG: hypothetical protein SO188_00920 [Prevotella sp.]|nr:hypothetical protein [Prevotella sp.]